MFLLWRAVPCALRQPIRIEEPLLEPCIIESTGASCELGAINAALPHFDLDALREYTKTVPFVLLILCGDGAMPNCRLKAFVTAWARKHNEEANTFGKILVLDVTCNTHTVTRIVISTFRYSEIIPKCYYISFAFRFPPRYNRALRALASIIEYDLVSKGGYFGGSFPPGACTGHASGMLSLIVTRPLRTRGRAGSEDGDQRSKNEVVQTTEDTTYGGTRVLRGGPTWVSLHSLSPRSGLSPPPGGGIQLGPPNPAAATRLAKKAVVICALGSVAGELHHAHFSA